MRVLLLVSDPGARRQLEDFFARRGLEVVSFADSANARFDVESRQEDLYRYALIDLETDPGTLDLMRAIQSSKAGEGTYVLVIPANLTADEMRATFESGADDYLNRPVELAQLQLRMAIAERRLASRAQKRKLAAELTGAERRYRTLVETMNEGLFQVGTDGVIQFANSRLCDLTGYSSHELVGESADEILVEAEVRSRLPEQHLLGAGTLSEEYSLPLRTKAGRRIWVNLTGAPLHDAYGKSVGSVGILEDVTDQRRAEEGLRYREQYFRALLESSSDLITILDIEGRVLYQSPACRQVLGWDSDDLVGQVFFDYLHAADRDRFVAAFEKSIESGDVTTPAQVRMRHQAEGWRYLETLCNNLIDNPVVGGIVVTSRDISEHRRLEDELKRERAFFQQLFRNSPSGIVILDNDDCIVDANRSWVRLFQHQLDDVKRRPLNDVIVPKNLHGEASELSQRIFDRESVDCETQRQRQDGTLVDVSIIGFPIELADRRIGAFGIYSDITERKRAERKLIHDAFHDSLTGLPNRLLLTQRLDSALTKKKRRKTEFALLFIDLDRFKIVNDSLGHKAGDELLIEMARRLQACVRPGDTTARLGGDEFTIVLEDLHNPDDGVRIAERILVALSRPFSVLDQEVACSGSIGIAYSATGYERSEEMVRDADIAMYRAKELGRARYAIFDTEMHEHAMERLRIETELRQAIDSQQLVLHYLPLLSLTTRQLVGFEALVRWRHPERGLMNPEQIIPVCEETGMIVALDRWVLNEACKQVAFWQKRFPENDAVFLSINLSVKDLAQPDFLGEVDDILKSSRVRPSLLAFEITEGWMQPAEEESVTRILWDLRKRGLRIYVDDFGTGHSSLSALHRYPIDALKIDRSYIQQLKPGGERFEIVRAIAALGESLGLRVIAEGVETSEQLAQVRRLELPYAQGFVFARPMPVDEAEKMITSRLQWPQDDLPVEKRRPAARRRKKAAKKTRAERS